MKWSAVRKLYPNQFVKLKVLSSYIENQQEIIEETAVIKPVSDELATKELLKSKGDELVYHTAHENIVLDIRQDLRWRIQKDQEWFWSEEWQKEEIEVEQQIQSGRTTSPMSLEETLSELDRMSNKKLD